jgi:peptide/nickel transport system substrate-binding protein
MRHGRAWVAAVAAVLVTSACGGASQPAASTGGAATTSTVAASAGKSVFTYAVNRPADDLDLVTQDSNADIWPLANVYETLVTINEKGDGYRPDLATSWDTSSDGLTWTFHLRSGVKFSNGDPMTSADVVWSLQRAHDTNGPWQWALAPVKTIAAPNASTVVITLSEPWAPFLADISLFSSSIMSKATFQNATEDTISKNPMGTGPYYVAQWVQGQKIVLKANPYYWQPGLPKTKEVDLPYVPDDNTRAIQLQSGQVDGIDAPAFGQLAQLRTNPDLNVLLDPSTAVALLSLNTKTGPTANVQFRQALAYAIDYQGLIKTIVFGNATPANSFLPETTLFYNKGMQGYAYDLAKAKALFAQSGVAPGTTLSMLLPSGNQVDQQTAVELKSMWSQLGITPQLLDPAAATARYRQDDFQVDITGWTNDIPDPDELTSYALGFTQSQSYHSQYHSAAMDALITKGETTLGTAARQQIYDQIQQMAMRDVPIIPLYYAPYTAALSKKVSGFVQLTTGPWLFANVTVGQ